MDLNDLRNIIDRLRRERSDVTNVEVKSAADGFPKSIPRTLSAFGNLPGGGLLIFGLDESKNFEPVGVYDVAKCKKALASLSRQVVYPPVSFTVDDFVMEGAPVVVAEIRELPRSAKPCREGRNARAYLRFYDGNYQLSDLEEQAFIANRDTPRFDQEPVPGTTVEDDLDSELVADYVRSSKAHRPKLAKLDSDEVLFRTGVTVGPDRVPSVAGLLALGVYPQQHFPNFAIQAHVPPMPGDPPGMRARDARRFDGPIPTMLEAATAWVMQNLRTRIRADEEGHVRHEPELPMLAVRELISNAIVHRDIGPHAFSYANTLRLEADQLVLMNPGGLWGVSVEDFGKMGVSSARNSWVLQICQHVRFGPDRAVVEALASGIPTILASLSASGITQPDFRDEGIRFTVRVPRPAAISSAGPDLASDVARSSKPKGSGEENAELIKDILSGNAVTRGELIAATGLTENQVRYALRRLRARGEVELRGGPGEASAYCLTAARPILEGA